jgi:hypothetical protein
MKLNPRDLKKITDRTLDHYNENAKDFWQGTRDQKVNQNIAALLQNIAGEPPFVILDFDCGPGRVKMPGVDPNRLADSAACLLRPLRHYSRLRLEGGRLYRRRVGGFRSIMKASPREAFRIAVRRQKLILSLAGRPPSGRPKQEIAGRLRCSPRAARSTMVRPTD